MNVRASVDLGTRSVLAFIAAMLTAFLLSTAASAQSPSDVQYDPPTNSGMTAVNDAEFPGGGSGAGTASAAGDPGADPLSGVLPSTGGSQVLMLALGTLALCAVGLLALNRVRR